MLQYINTRVGDLCFILNSVTFLGRYDGFSISICSEFILYIYYHHFNGKVFNIIAGQLRIILDIIDGTLLS